MFYKLYLRFIKKNWQLYTLYFITLLTIPLSETVMPDLYGKIIANLKGSNMDKSTKIFMKLIGIWISIQILNLAQSYINMHIVPKFQSFIRQYFFDRIIESYSENYQELELGKIISKIIRSPGIVQSIFVEIKDFLLSNMFMTVSNFIYLSSHNLTLGIIFLISVIFIYILSYIYFRVCNGYITDTQESYDQVHEEIQDTLSNLISIYTSQQSKNEKIRIREYNITTNTNQRNTYKCNNKFRIMFSLVYIIVFLALNYYAYKLLKDKEIKLSAFVSIFILNYSIFSFISSFYYDAYTFMNMYTKVNHITDFIEGLPIYKSANGIELQDTEDLNIAFDKVVFRHSPTVEPIYNGLSFEIPFGQSVAVMGTIGSGKSTMAKLLVRLQKYHGGAININEHKIEDLDLINLRKNVLYVPQHPILFNRTLWDNISYGLGPEIQVEDFYNVLRENGMGDLVEIYESKMYEKVGKTGSNLSGGQRQIIWLIRCLLRPSKIIILDEPTSALDEKNAQNVIKLIRKLSEGRTLIVITHDSDLLPYMDRMIFFDKGEIVKDEML
jgi:ABC-type multidrug transport system fused ATPase/permease subunit